MPPKKLNPKRKKAKTTGASTSSAPQRDLLSTKDYAEKRKEKFEDMDFMNHKYLDWDLLREYGMQERIQQIIQDQAWLRLFALKEPAYRDVTIEFLSTMIIENDRVSTTLTFQAYGEVHVIELKQIGVYMGLYDSDEEVINLPNSFPQDMSAEAFWFQLIQPRQDDFVPSKSLSTTFAAVEHKLLHHILAHTICCKKTSHSKVTSFDMYYLYSLITGHRIDLGIEIANFLDRQVTDTRTRVLMCGGYITALLKGMHLFQQPEADEGIQCKRISAGPFRTWGLTKVPLLVEPAIEAAVHEPPPVERASTSQHPPSASAYDHLEAHIWEIKEDIKRERRKNKKFRSTLFQMLKSAISCFNPTSAEQLHYETSSEEASSTEPES